MIRTIALACLLATSATAQQMAPDTCRAGWHAFNTLIGESADMADAQPIVTARGWCRIDSSNAKLNANDFGSLEFRGWGIDQAVASQGAPKTLDVVIEGIDLIEGLNLPIPTQYAGPRGTMRISYHSVPETRDLTISALDIDFGGLGHLKITAEGGGVDLTSFSAMQLSSGAARVTDLTLQLQATPVLKSSLFPPLAAAMGQPFVEAIPEDAILESSRDALLAFLSSSPDAGGLLRISASSDAGVGFLQMVGGVMPLEEKGMSEETISNAMSVLFNGVSISADWTGIE